jgi:MoaA/NifB/PqqE/SkfB family radical SAM enzyme
MSSDVNIVTNDESIKPQIKPSFNPSDVSETKYKNDVKTLIFYITNRCNFRCNHCFYWDSLNKKDILTMDIIKKIVNGVGELDTLLIAGGEPFLRKEIIEVCEYFIEKTKVRLISTPTNGSMGPKVKEFIKRLHNKVRLRIYISLDGLKKTHNHIRQVDSFDTAISLLKDLVEMKKDYNFSPLSMITVSNKNIHEIVPLGRLLKNIGVHYSITPLRGTPKDSAIQPPTSKEWGELVKTLEREANFLGGDSSFHNNSANPLKQLHRKLQSASKTRMYKNALDGKRKYICKAGDEIGVIDYDGSVLFCELTKKIGNLKDYDWNFNKLWNSKTAQNYRPEVKTCVCTHGCFIKSKYMRTAEWLSKMIYPTS